LSDPITGAIEYFPSGQISSRSELNLSLILSVFPLSVLTVLSVLLMIVSSNMQLKSHIDLVKYVLPISNLFIFFSPFVVCAADELIIR